MRKLIAQFVKHPFYANMIIGIVAIAGIMGYMSMKKSFFPEMVTRNISVSVIYPGASPKEMEEASNPVCPNRSRGRQYPCPGLSRC